MGKREKIKKILIANRGEIAVRIINTARRLGIRTVVIYSAVDADSLHAGMGDESFCIGAAELSETYLDIPKIIRTALDFHCDAIHPGYGFLAENPLFVKACEDAGIIFIGPDSNSMHMMGNKIGARAFAGKIGIPVTEGLTGTPEYLLENASKISFPILIKAAAGGGGKGMQIVRKQSELKAAIESAARQAKAYFGDETVYIEKYIDEPRHIEFQILGDNYGNVVHLFERECSIQRRYQKIIEESPSPTLTPEIRAMMGEAAVRIGREIGYRNAGTIEFLVDKDLNFYFLEMNTRIQVEHPVTELVTGTDIVEEQIRIAEGQPLRLNQEMITQNGHAIECRIYAEDPSNNFLPSPGRMSLYREPVAPGIRIDTGVTAATEIKSNFDPMISKLIVYGKDRNEAAKLMEDALSAYVIHGIRTNIPYLLGLVKSEAFLRNRISTKFCDEHTADILAGAEQEKLKVPAYIPISGYLMASLQNPHLASTDKDPWQQVGYWRNLVTFRLEFENTPVTVMVPAMAGNRFKFDFEGEVHPAQLLDFDGNRVDFAVDGARYSAYFSEDPDGTATFSLDGYNFALKRLDILPEVSPAASADLQGDGAMHVNAPMPGKVIRIEVEPGQAVKKGQVMLILEAMKMENAIIAARDAVVGSVNVTVNQVVEASAPLIIFEPRD
jgi:3-methylcrotonyl-CoA carboxylase alpha subunit